MTQQCSFSTGDLIFDDDFQAMCLYVLDNITSVNSVNTEQTTKLNELTASLDQEKVKVNNLEGQCTYTIPSVRVFNRQGSLGHSSLVILLDYFNHDE